jgi:hypothetical protein
MKTEDLIERLGTELHPVRPLAPPWRRAGTWAAIAAAYVSLVVLASWIRRGTLLGISDEPVYLVQQLALIGTAFLGVVAAFASVVPGYSRRVQLAALVPAAIVMMTLAWGMVRDLDIHGAIGLGRETDWPCVMSIVVGGAILWSVAAVMLRRGAPLSPAATSLLAGLAAVSLANVEACVTRQHVFSVTVLVWHGLTSALVITVAVVSGRHLLTWPREHTSD